LRSWIAFCLLAVPRKATSTVSCPQATRHLVLVKESLTNSRWSKLYSCIAVSFGTSSPCSETTAPHLFPFGQGVPHQLKMFQVVQLHSCLFWHFNSLQYKQKDHICSYLVKGSLTNSRWSKLYSCIAVSFGTSSPCSETTALSNPEMSILIHRRHPYTENLKRETSGACKDAFLHCGDVLAPLLFPHESS